MSPSGLLAASGSVGAPGEFDFIVLFQHLVAMLSGRLPRFGAPSFGGLERISLCCRILGCVAVRS